LVGAAASKPPYVLNLEIMVNSFLVGNKIFRIQTFYSETTILSTKSSGKSHFSRIFFSML
jgi:hypothetical protein